MVGVGAMVVGSMFVDSVVEPDIKKVVGCVLKFLKFNVAVGSG